MYMLVHRWLVTRGCHLMVISGQLQPQASYLHSIQEGKVLEYLFIGKAKVSHLLFREFPLNAPLARSTSYPTWKGGWKTVRGYPASILHIVGEKKIRLFIHGSPNSKTVPKFSASSVDTPLSYTIKLYCKYCYEGIFADVIKDSNHLT